jgi:hypothetical protein
MLCVILAHNLNRELQMRTSNEQSSPLWVFEKINPCAMLSSAKLADLPSPLESLS